MTGVCEALEVSSSAGARLAVVPGGDLAMDWQYRTLVVPVEGLRADVNVPFTLQSLVETMQGLYEEAHTTWARWELEVVDDADG